MKKECGVRILYEPEKYPPRNDVPWHVVLDDLHHLVSNANWMNKSS